MVYETMLGIRKNGRSGQKHNSQYSFQNRHGDVINGTHKIFDLIVIEFNAYPLGSKKTKGKYVFYK